MQNLAPYPFNSPEEFRSSCAASHARALRLATTYRRRLTVTHIAWRKDCVRRAIAMYEDVAKRNEWAVR